MDTDTDGLEDSFDTTKPYLDLSTNRLSVEDAIGCLTGKYNVVLPTPHVRPCNNLDEYLHKSTLSTRKTPKDGKDHQTSSKNTSRRDSNPSVPFAVPLVRDFERILKKTAPDTQASPSSMPTNPKRARADIFTKTDQINTNSGPLSLLKRRLNQKVTVLIRRRKKVPYISRSIEYKGTLTMFDKHMNMFLKDVIESFKFHKDGKLLKRGRHRSGVMVRGDNVILVV